MTDGSFTVSREQGEGNLQSPERHQQCAQRLDTEVWECGRALRHYVERGGYSGKSHRNAARQFKLTLQTGRPMPR